MKKAIPIALIFVMVLLAFQTTQAPVLVTRIEGLTSSWAGECAAGILDNTSAISRMATYHAMAAGGTGTWTASMSYSNTSCSGPWTAYPASATISQSSGLPVAYAFDPTYVPAKYIRFTFTGTVSAIYTGTRYLYLPAGTGGGTVGPSGGSGPSGPAGAKGASGPSGAAGSSATGATGASGPSGPSGAAGAAGATGATGITGASGPSGPAGAAGATGATGASGASGPSGPSGPIATATLPQRIRICEVPIGTVTGSVLANGDDMLARCLNRYTIAETIQNVQCYADAGTPTVLPIITGGAANSILTGAMTCGTGAYFAGSLNGSPSLAGGSSIDVNIAVAGGTAKYVVIVFQLTLP